MQAVRNRLGGIRSLAAAAFVVVVSIALAAVVVRGIFAIDLMDWFMQGGGPPPQPPPPTAPSTR